MPQLLKSAAVGLALLFQHVSASTIHPVARRDGEPGFPVKPDTITTCTNWYDNWLGEDCKVVRDWYFAISPEDFHRWNPSISLDCGGWEKWHSYCVGVRGQQSSSSSSTSTLAATTSISTAAPAPTPVLKSWEPMGCFVDDFTLTTKSTREGGSNLTVEKCQAACWLDSFRFAGLKSGTECWCGTSVGGDWAKDQADCKTPCPGNSVQKCGGDKLLSVFRAVLDETPLPPGGQPPSITTTTSTAATTTTAAPLAATWVPQGCYKDLAPATVRPLPDRLINNAASLTVAACHTACRNAGYALAGVENGNQCFCGHDIQEPALNTFALESDCNKPCTGNSVQTCGGAGRMFVYRYAVPRQQAWQSLGCYKDLAPTTPRPLPDRLINNAVSLTVQACQTACRSSSGKTLAGVENGNQCFCGHDIQEPATNIWVSPSECTKPCTGNSSENCGAAARMYIYKYATPERQVWRSLGCYLDLYPAAPRTLDAMLRSGSTITIESCHALCQASVYKYAGLENGSQCWCGNEIRDPSTNVLTVMSECGTTCAGNKDQTCGRSARMHIYEYVAA